MSQSRIPLIPSPTSPSSNASSVSTARTASRSPSRSRRTSSYFSLDVDESSEHSGETDDTAAIAAVPIAGARAEDGAEEEERARDVGSRLSDSLLPLARNDGSSSTLRLSISNSSSSNSGTKDSRSSATSMPLHAHQHRQSAFAERNQSSNARTDAADDRRSARQDSKKRIPLFMDRYGSYNQVGRRGREAGIDPTRYDLPLLDSSLVIQKVTYNRDRATYVVFDNATFIRSLRGDDDARSDADEAKKSETGNDDGRSTKQCTWIHINGLSWDVLTALSEAYAIHPLAIEDIVHHRSSLSFPTSPSATASSPSSPTRQSSRRHAAISSTSSVPSASKINTVNRSRRNRSKIDYYPQHLFLSLMVHSGLYSEAKYGEAHSSTLSLDGNGYSDDDGVAEDEASVGLEEEDAGQGSRGEVYRNARGSERVRARNGYEAFCEQGRRAFERAERENAMRSSSGNYTSPATFPTMDSEEWVPIDEKDADRQAARHTVDALQEKMNVPIQITSLSLFLTRNHTILTLSPSATPSPRLAALFDRLSSADNLLRTSEDASMLLQAVLDGVGDSALDIVEEFEGEIEGMEGRVLSRPVMSTVRHLHALSAQLLLLKSAISPLQSLIQSLRYSDEIKSISTFDAHSSALPVPATTATHRNQQQKQQQLGFISKQAKVYLSDTLDHIDSVVSSLDLFSSICEGLISYTFNSMSFASTQYMQALSVLSVIFLPLTFLSGYFGMNFQSFPHVLDGDVVYFWKIAVPIVVATVFVFASNYLQELYRSLRREARRVYHRKQFKRRVE